LLCLHNFISFFFSSRRRHTRFSRDWSSDVCSSDLVGTAGHILFASAAAYPLAKYKFPGSNTLFAIVVLSLMFSPHVTAVPNYMRSEERRVGKECRYSLWSSQ